MNSVVNKLLDVDKQARLILDEAQQYYDRMITDIAAEKEKMAAGYKSKAHKHFEEIRSAETAALTASMAEIKEKYERLTSELDEAFEKNHTGWENELLNKCLGR